VLQEAGAIHQREEHGWMQDRVDPHARDRTVDFAQQIGGTASLPTIHVGRPVQSAAGWRQPARLGAGNPGPASQDRIQRNAIPMRSAASNPRW
jgi:hypothetical protein